MKSGALVTAPEGRGSWQGSPAHISSRWRLSWGSAVLLRDIQEHEVYEADEVFISSSIREVLAVVRVEGRMVGEGRPGPLTRQLHDAFRRRVAVETVTQG